MIKPCPNNPAVSYDDSISYVISPCQQPSNQPAPYYGNASGTFNLPTGGTFNLPSGIDYTPFIIGGIAFVLLLAIMKR